MYDSRSWFSSRLFVGLCLSFWFFSGASSSLAVTGANSDPSTAKAGGIFTYNGYNYTLGSYLGQKDFTYNGSFFADSHGYYVLAYDYWGVKHYGKYNWYSVGGCVPVPSDSDSDGLYDDHDPCPDTPDNYFNHYLVPNICDGSYYFFQITGECGETKTYYNPKYSDVGAAYQDSIAHPDCTGDPQVKSVTPGQVQGFFDSHSGSSSPAGDGVILDQPVDLTGGSSSNSTAPAEVTSTDPNTQSVVDAIKLMRDSLKSKLDDVSSDITDRIQVDSDRIVSAIKTTSNNVSSLGTSISGVTSAVTSAGNTAHADALALKTAIEGIKSGNATASTSGGMTSDDMRSIIEEDRNLVYTADPGINTDTGLASQGLISSIVGIVGTIQTKVQSIVPDLDVDMSSASPCISGGSITFPDGSSHSVNGLCLDSYENHFVMVGNVLYAFVCIVGVLSIFGMRRE